MHWNILQQMANFKIKTTSTYDGISSSIKGEAAAHKASALANSTLLIKLPPANLAAILLLRPKNK